MPVTKLHTNFEQTLDCLLELADRLEKGLRGKDGLNLDNVDLITPDKPGTDPFDLETAKAIFNRKPLIADYEEARKVDSSNPSASGTAYEVEGVLNQHEFLAVLMRDTVAQKSTRIKTVGMAATRAKFLADKTFSTFEKQIRGNVKTKFAQAAKEKE